jgi:acetate kinase
MSILVFNAGSTSLKFELFDREARASLLTGEIDWDDGNRQQARLVLRASSGGALQSKVAVPDDHAATAGAIRAVQAWHGQEAKPAPGLAVVGHRVVHGGTEFRESVLITERVKASLARLGELAPLHNPPALQAIEMAEQTLPGVPQVAVFDTTFFAQLPPREYVYPLPYEWHEQWGIRRFGFHGISHAYCAGRTAELLGRDLAGLRLVCCHLGGGCSATAVRDGVAVATTLGFTPMEGLMMGTRSGSVDPGVLLHLQRRRGLTVEQLERALNHSSGLLGVSGLAPDHAQIEAAAAQGHPRAQLAFDMFADRVRSAIGALSVNLGGLDVLVFTAGVGERSAALRTAACHGLECLGLRLDPDRNAACQPDTDIAAPDSTARVLVIRTREELMIAREARRVTA